VAAPAFQTLILPTLEALADGQSRSEGSVCELVAARLGVSPEDRRELLPGGTQPRYGNRVSWALYYMRQAGVLISPAGGQYQITDRGRSLLGEGLTRIDQSVLERFTEFLEFKRSRLEDGIPVLAVDSEITAQERLESAHRELRDRLASEVLERLRALSPISFERVVLDVLAAMGYGGSVAGCASLTARSGEGSVHGIIKEDKLGFDILVVQAKQWAHAVGKIEIREFAGSLESHGARKGLFITTAQFSGPARDYVTRIEKRIVLIDGKKLAELMMDHDVGVTVTSALRLQRIDTDYFEQDLDL
jgi:restriction system protein